MDLDLNAPQRFLVASDTTAELRKHYLEVSVPSSVPRVKAEHAVSALIDRHAALRARLICAGWESGIQIHIEDRQKSQAGLADRMFTLEDPTYRWGSLQSQVNSLNPFISCSWFFLVMDGSQVGTLVAVVHRLVIDGWAAQQLASQMEVLLSEATGSLPDYASSKQLEHYAVEATGHAEALDTQHWIDCLAAIQITRLPVVSHSLNTPIICSHERVVLPTRILDLVKKISSSCGTTQYAVWLWAIAQTVRKHLGGDTLLASTMVANRLQIADTTSLAAISNLVTSPLDFTQQDTVNSLQSIARQASEAARYGWCDAVRIAGAVHDIEPNGPHLGLNYVINRGTFQGGQPFVPRVNDHWVTSFEPTVLMRPALLYVEIFNEGTTYMIEVAATQEVGLPGAPDEARESLFETLRQHWHSLKYG